MQSNERLMWPDVARGVSICLVVIMHVHTIVYEKYFLTAAGGELVRMWDILVSATQPFRMPLFFLISGYLASRAATKPWAQIARGRVYNLVYLYYTWLFIQVVVDWGQAALLGTAYDVRRGLWQILWPESMLWFIYALVVYFLIARVTREWSLGLVVSVALLASILATTFLPLDTPQYFIRCLVFFLVGVRAPQHVDQVMRAANWPRTAMLALLYGLLCIVMWLTWRRMVVIYTLTSFIGVIGVLWASHLTSATKIAGLLSGLGRRTLPIYVIHPVLISLTITALKLDHDLVELLAWNGLTAASIPILLTISYVLLSLVMEALAARTGFGFLFKLPGVFGKREQRLIKPNV